MSIALVAALALAASAATPEGLKSGQQQAFEGLRPPELVLPRIFRIPELPPPDFRFAPSFPAAPAFPGSSWNPQTGRSTFETLRELFEGGALPVPEDLRGWRYGRCYLAWEPNAPEPSILGATRRPGDNGPLFGSAEVFKLIPLSVPAGWATPPTRDQLLEVGTTLLEFASDPQWAPVALRDGSVVEEYVGDTEFRTRRSGPYLVMLATQLVGRGDAAPAGQVSRACYYAEPLR